MKRTGWLMLLLSSVCCAGWIWQVLEARSRAEHFEPVEATVIANRIHKSWVNPTSEHTLNQYRAEYLLQYSFAGQSYRHWVADELNTTQRFRAEAVLGQMCPGAQTKVYVDPQNPIRMVMHIRGWRAYIPALIFAALATVFGSWGIGALLLHGFRSRSKRPYTSVVYLN